MAEAVKAAETPRGGRSLVRRLSGLGKGSWPLWAAAVVIVAAGMFLRLMGLTDEPLDFHPTAQLLRALTARGMYLNSSAIELAGQPSAAASAYEVFEPPILERLVAWTYQIVGGEHAWIARIWNAFFWLLAALVLSDLARRSTSLAGGLVTLAYFLILPLGVLVSRAFMPDSLMVLMIVVSGSLLVRWSRSPAWGPAILAGLACGAAILVKGRIAPMILVSVLMVGLGDRRWRRLLREPQLWVIGILTVVIPGLYYGILISTSTAGWVSDFTLAVVWMLLDPSYYSRWLAWLDQLVYVGVMLLGFVGTVLLPAEVRRLNLGWWAGFVVTSMLVPYHAVTHSYYSLPLVPAIALGLAPVGQLLQERLRRLSIGWKALAAAASLLMVFYPAWRSRSVIVGNDYRGEPLGWQRVGQALPTDGAIIAITQDYGYRLTYYSGRTVSLWPSVADQDYAELRGHNTSDDFTEVFAEKAQGYRYFLVTNMGELEAQPDLDAYLRQNFPIVREGDGYLLFDLE